MAATPARVLIVEDDPDISLIERVILERSGFTTTLARNGEMALVMIERERPDAVVLDLTMPGSDGWSVLSSIVTSVEGPPVVVCSARGNAHDVERALSMGAFAFVAKPFDLEALVRSVTEATGVQNELEGADAAEFEPA